MNKYIYGCWYVRGIGYVQGDGCKEEKSNVREREREEKQNAVIYKKSSIQFYHRQLPWLHNPRSSNTSWAKAEPVVSLLRCMTCRCHAVTHLPCLALFLHTHTFEERASLLACQLSRGETHQWGGERKRLLFSPSNNSQQHIQKAYLPSCLLRNSLNVSPQHPIHHTNIYDAPI